MRPMDVLTGIIPEHPAYDDHDYPELFTFKAPIDHYAVTKGSNDKKSPNYTPGCHQKKPAINIPVVGSLYKKETFPGINYNGIELTTTIRDGIIAEITPELNVTLNGILIATSPKYATTKTGKDKTRTQAEKLRFCKAVVWALINDETSLKDKLVDIGYVPPVNDSVKDFMIENITLSPFPGPGIVEEIEYTEMYAYRQKERDDRETIIKEYDDDPMESQYETTGSYLDADNNLETADEIIRSFCDMPVIQPKTPAGPYRSWSLPHLRCTILEVPI